MTSPFRLEPLAGEHIRASFACGEEAPDRYFKTHVTQDIRRRITNCFVAIETISGQIAGYYTLSSASILFTDLPATEAKRLPRYPTLPAVRIGRLAVDQQLQERRLGAALLADAVRRTLSAPPAAYALLVDAKHDAAVTFYQHHGFQLLFNQSRTLFLPLATAEKLLSP